MKADDWERELTAYKKEFIDSQGWNEKQAESFIRDAWVCLRDGRLKVCSTDGQDLADALPVFQFRTPEGWRLPVPLLIHAWERLRTERGGLDSSLAPRERVCAIIAEQGAPPEGDLLKTRLKESELKLIIAQQAARDLENICDSDELQTARDPVWLAILAAIRFGRRQVLAEIFADEEAMQENVLGRLMNRKGRSAKARKRMDLPTNTFRERVQSLVRERLKVGKDAPHVIRTFVESRLFSQGMRRDGLNFVFGDAIAKIQTVRKWMRQELRSLTA